MRRFILLVVLCAGCKSAAIDEKKLVDLTYSFNDQTVYWPTAKQFHLERVAFGPNQQGKWYATNDYSASEHGGTHLDAPIHFAEERRTVEKIPLSQLIGPVRVIDIHMACIRDPDYLLLPADIFFHESRFGRLEPGTIVLIRTGFGQYYPDPLKYLGSDERGIADDLHFPGISREAAQLLVDRRVDLVGIDTASIDHGPSKDFAAHRVLSRANIPALENVANLGRLPEEGATLIALPMKIEGGSGGPCRVVAILP